MDAFAQYVRAMAKLALHADDEALPSSKRAAVAQSELPTR